MKKLRRLKNSIWLKITASSILWALKTKLNTKIAGLTLTGIILVASSCKKDKGEVVEDKVQAQTSIRLVHGSYLSNATPADLYVDDVKLTTAAITFTAASAYYPTASGARKIVAKNATGTVLADTTINIAEGNQYSFFIKDRSWISAGATALKLLKTGLIPVIDNHTAPPVQGMAKVKFVNSNSQALNSFLGSLTFLLVNPGANAGTATTITQSLGIGNDTIVSEYSSFQAGEITFRVHGATTIFAVLDPIYTTDLIATLEAGKLYTIYATSTPFTIKTTTKSPLQLNIIATN